MNNENQVTKFREIFENQTVFKNIVYPKKRVTTGHAKNKAEETKEETERIRNLLNEEILSYPSLQLGSGCPVKKTWGDISRNVGLSSPKNFYFKRNLDVSILENKRNNTNNGDPIGSEQSVIEHHEEAFDTKLALKNYCKSRAEIKNNFYKVCVLVLRLNKANVLNVRKRVLNRQSKSCLSLGFSLRIKEENLTLFEHIPKPDLNAGLRGHSAESKNFGGKNKKFDKFRCIQIMSCSGSPKKKQGRCLGRYSFNSIRCIDNLDLSQNILKPFKVNSSHKIRRISVSKQPFEINTERSTEFIEQMYGFNKKMLNPEKISNKEQGSNWQKVSFSLGSLASLKDRNSEQPSPKLKPLNEANKDDRIEVSVDSQKDAKNDTSLILDINETNQNCPETAGQLFGSLNNLNQMPTKPFTVNTDPRPRARGSSFVYTTNEQTLDAFKPKKRSFSISRKKNGIRVINPELPLEGELPKKPSTTTSVPIPKETYFKLISNKPPSGKSAKKNNFKVRPVRSFNILPKCFQKENPKQKKEEVGKELNKKNSGTNTRKTSSKSIASDSKK